MEIVYENDPCGGKGHMKLEKLLGPDALGDKVALYARVTLHPGESVGYHVHKGDGESYFILSGIGEYNDNGTVFTVRPGDVMWTPDGSGHALANNGTEDVVFMALIINS